MRLSTLLLTLPLACAIPATATSAAPKKPAAAQSAPAISAETMKRLVKELSSDAFEGRAPGSAGEQKTLDLLVAEFSRLGLKPGNQGSWFQSVPLVEITAKNVSPPE